MNKLNLMLGNVVKGGISQVEVDSASNSLERDHDLFIGQEVKSNTNTGGIIFMQ